MWDNVKAFFVRPYKGATEMDTTDWFLWTGFVLILLMIWGMIFRHVAMGIKGD